MMNTTKLDCSLNDTSGLRKLIIENPELPLIIFCSEEACCEDFGYTQAMASNGSIERLTLYDDLWIDEDDYKEKLADDLCDVPEYKDLPDSEYFKMIDQKVSETEFVEAIVIYVG